MNIEFVNITKRFGRFEAIKGISFSIRSGAIHAILGQNGAGKSTLMKMLAGHQKPDEGLIRIDGRDYDGLTPAEAIGAEVGMLFQDPLDFPRMTALENFRASGRRSMKSAEAARRKYLELQAMFGFSIDPDCEMATLSVGERQQAEILRLLHLGVRCLILDEPTTAISEDQRKTLFDALRKLAAQNKTILFVTHKIPEMEQICEKVTVLRSGALAGELTVPADRETLIDMILGRSETTASSRFSPGEETAVEFRGVALKSRLLELKPVDCTIRKGEIVGLAGLEGSGQQILLRIGAGILRPDGGVIMQNSRDMTGKPYKAFLDNGVAFLPAGRLEEGLIGGMSMFEHVALTYDPSGLMIDIDRVRQAVEASISSYHIVATCETKASQLSGGNQQRLMFALLPPRLNFLCLEHPTRGLDIENCGFVWESLMNRAKNGAAILFSSSDLDELIERSHRILAFYSGSVIAELDASKTTPREIGEYIGGKAPVHR